MSDAVSGKYVPTLGYAVSSETGSGALTPGAVVLSFMIGFSVASTEGGATPLSV